MEIGGELAVVNAFDAFIRRALKRKVDRACHAYTIDLFSLTISLWASYLSIELLLYPSSSLWLVDDLFYFSVVVELPIALELLL